ncbi:MAG: class I SAM-dependent methyltransferase [Oscillospiraceae bacterium]|jgi:SAM-dependent methyltransferase|nr:class I SAM-dependent methyltransferase [Oscillospiraceae bacterium]
MALGWINPEDFSFNSILLMERFQIRFMLSSHAHDGERRRALGIALRANPAVRWYIERMCPESAAFVAGMADNSPEVCGAADIRRAEVYTLGGIEDFVIYTQPELMQTHCPFIYGWHKDRLFEMADFDGKIVLDVGSGSGRLAFAAAERAKEVYASEPVATLRAFIQDKAEREGIHNIRVSDGFANRLAYPNHWFDIVMSGHVVGDDYEGEIAELTRVCKPGGWLLDCRGDQLGNDAPFAELRALGWEEMWYRNSFGKDTYRYRFCVPV